jgi:UDP-N-acetylglucosamine/UDP-N-acetylgalactosamine diphosphorylase
MLNQPPIFLGGQGGLVGPVRIGYGCVIAAGTVCRRDCPEGGKILCDSGHPRTEREFHPGLYKDIEKKVFNNIYYVANLLALRQWYHHIRRIFFQGQELGDELYQGAVETLQLAIEERLTRCKTLSEKMEVSIAVGQQILSGERRSLLLHQQKEFMKNWPDIESNFTAEHEKAVDHSNRDAFLEIIRLKVKEAGTDYINVITNLDRPSAAKGTAWLQNIVDHVTGRVLMNLPSFRYPERTA